MAIGSSLPTASLSNLGTQRSAADALPLGARGSISLGSGLRSGLVLVDSANRAVADLQEARGAAAEAAREAARANAELARTERETERADALQAANGSDTAAATTTAASPTPSADDTNRSIGAAQVAGQSGETSSRGAFVDLAV